jgi:hypothetical protein
MLNPKNIIITKENLKFTLFKDDATNQTIKETFMDELEQKLSGGRRFRRNRRSVKRRGSKKTLKKRSNKYGGKRSGKSKKKAKKYTNGKKW